jgi:radical SAM protein with 4Fe4S-binding SPASM domain
VERLAAELGVDEVQIMGAYLGGPGHTPYTGHPKTRELADQWLTDNPKYRPEFNYYRPGGYLSDARCYFLWRTVAVNWDGSLTPCCCVYEESANFGNLMEEAFPGIWNNAKYRSARALFGRGRSAERVSTVCAACKTFRHTASAG